MVQGFEGPAFETMVSIKAKEAEISRLLVLVYYENTESFIYHDATRWHHHDIFRIIFKNFLKTLSKP